MNSNNNKPEQMNAKLSKLCFSKYKDELFKIAKTTYSPSKSGKHHTTMHKMEKEIKHLDFSFLNIEKINAQIENESFELYMKFLSGD